MLSLLGAAEGELLGVFRGPHIPEAPKSRRYAILMYTLGPKAGMIHTLGAFRCWESSMISCVRPSQSWAANLKTWTSPSNFSRPEHETLRQAECTDSSFTCTVHISHMYVCMYTYRYRYINVYIYTHMCRYIHTDFRQSPNQAYSHCSTIVIIHC